MQPMYYIGLDVHTRKISYCVKDSGGKLHSEGSIPATHFDLDRWMKTHQELAKGPAHPFYDRANELLEAEQFDEFAEKECAKLGCVIMVEGEKRGYIASQERGCVRCFHAKPRKGTGEVASTAALAQQRRSANGPAVGSPIVDLS